jgi:metal-responsive CopG/Arc/MetJ family transcriptional regulator
MKSGQITLDEALLRRIDAADETKAHSRSHVLRRAAEAYPRQIDDEAIRARYAQG